MTTSSGWLLPVWKSAGLCSTPSISAPSPLFQRTISTVPSVQPAAWAVMSVSVRGWKRATLETATSGRWRSPAMMNAAVWKSLLSEGPPMASRSGAEIRVIAPAGGMRNRCESVR